MNSDRSRRAFLHTAALLVIGGIPSRLPVRIFPGDNGTHVTLTYTLNLDDFPQLNRVGGSVKLVSEQQLKFNPDHIANRDRLKPAPRGRYPIVITRVAESGPEQFTALSTFCSHGAGYQLNDYDPVACVFTCPHRGSTFTPYGTPVKRPGAPSDLGPLRCFPVAYDSELRTITLTNV